MPTLRTRSPNGRSILRRRLAWPILIIAVAIPVAFISGRLERERLSAAEAYGHAVAEWDAQTTCPSWLSDSAAHPVQLMDLARRLTDRGPVSGPATVEATLEETGSAGFRWRVVLDWPEAPSIDLLLGFENLDTTPRLIGVGGESGPPEDTP